MTVPNFDRTSPVSCETWALCALGVKQKLICASRSTARIILGSLYTCLVWLKRNCHWCLHWGSPTKNNQSSPIGWDAHDVWSPSLILCVQHMKTLPVKLWVRPLPETVRVCVQCTLLPQKVFGVNHTGACCVYPSPTARGVSLHIQAVSVAALSADRKSGMTKQQGDWHPSRPPRHSAWRCTHRWML